VDALEPWHIWTILGLVIVIAEIFTAGFVLACFSVGCIVAAALAYWHLGIPWQLVGFSAASLAAFVGVRPFALRHMASGEPLRTNVDAMIGRAGVVSQRLDPATGKGRVLIDGEDWWGVTDSARAVEPGERVVVVKVDGTRLIVEPESTGREG
jgi:membrane protein implicated in regulation of membrane protease activity